MKEENIDLLIKVLEKFVKDDRFAYVVLKMVIFIR